MVAIGAIKILDTHTINKIAAGEVVERPASVVKELVENSIDAKASSITIEIKNGGIDFIRVTDNGLGIPKEQVEVAFLRHATSKITSAEDLYEVISLGFRGEALASIASVSNVELITKVAEDLTGKKVEVSGGKITSSEEIACPNGTTFIMRHLFFNVPARREFLSSVGAEGAKISDYIYKLALAHPEISFKYIQNNKTVFTTSGDHDLTHCVLNIYGKDYAKNTFKCHYEQSGIECVGLLGNPSLNRGNRNFEHFFINGRYIKSTLLQKAVEDAYKTLVMVGKFPFVVLHIYVDPALVDVNVHPTKLQVRFKDMDFIYNAVYKAITSQLQKENLVPELTPYKEESRQQPILEPTGEQVSVDTFFAPRKTNNEVTPDTLLAGERPHHYEVPTSKEITGYEEMVKETPHIERLFGVPKLGTFKEVSFEDHPVDSTPISKAAPIMSYIPPRIEPVEAPTEPAILASDYRIVGQLFKTYWLIQYHEKVFIIDQHAAHERVLYEKFMAHFKNNTVATQLLLMPETLHVTATEKELLNTQGELFKRLGFEFEDFGEEAIVIREVPFILNEPLSPSVFRDVLDTLSHDKLQDITDIKAESIIRMSCRSAIKAHDQISDLECQKLIESLLALDNPFTCPHGRPTLVALTQSDIEKMFKRI